MVKKPVIVSSDECNSADLLNKGEMSSLEHGLRYFVVPFLTAETDDKAIDIYKRYHVQNVLKRESKNNKILKFREILSAMLKIAIFGKQGKELPPELIEKIPMVEKCIMDAASTEKPVIFWRGKTGTYVLDRPIVAPKREFGSGVYAWILSLTVEFRRYPGDTLRNAALYFGYDIVGLCPNCGIFFAKGRTDQLYCSKRCKGTDLKRLERQRKKVSTNN